MHQVVYDTVIVGGGVAGLNTAFKLIANGVPPKGILLVEQCSDLGGRIETKERCGMHLEYGPMRYEPTIQTRLMHLLDELGVDTEDFTAYASPNDDIDYNRLRVDEINVIEQDRAKFRPHGVGLALLKHAVKCVLDEQWNVDKDDIHRADREQNKRWLREHGTFQGRPLWKYGMWDTFAHVLSKEALDYLKTKGSFYHILDQNPNAADHMCFMLDILATMRHGLKTVKGGSYTVVQKLHERVSGAGIPCLLGTTLKRLETSKHNRRHVVCHMQTGTSITAKHVVLAMHAHGLKNLTGLPSLVQSQLHAVIQVPLFKIFVEFDNPPFDESTVPPANHNATNIPCREVHYMYDKATSKGVILIYGDAPAVNYWSTFVPTSTQEKASEEDNLPMKNHLIHYIRQLLPGYTYPNITYYGIRDWSMPPFGAGVHIWKPKWRSGEVMDHFAGFSLSRTCTHKNVHICGEAYSDYQGFIEGALRTSDAVVERVVAHLRREEA